LPSLLLLTLAALQGSFMVSYSTAKGEALHVVPPRGSMRRPERAVYLIAASALSAMTVPWLERGREAAVPLAHPMIVALGMIAALANISALERLIAISQLVRQRARVRDAGSERQITPS
jgi:hypothetical protein